MNQLQPLLAMVWESLENTVLNNHPQTSEDLGKSKFPMEKFQHKIGVKECKFGCIGDVSPTQDNIVQCQERLSQPVISPMGESENT